MNTDYPRMLFHRTKDPVTVLSREEEDALGPEWSRRIWQGEPQALEPDPAPIPLEPEPPLFDDPEPEPEPQPEPEPEEVPVPVAPKRRAGRPAAAKPATKKAVRRTSK